MKKYLISMFFILGVLGTPLALKAQTVSSGLTTAEISAIVSLLQSFGASQSVISNVEVALGASTTTAPSGFCYAWTTDLGVGSSGPDVTALGEALFNLGITDRPYANNDHFDQSLAAAVVQYQQKNNISPVTGYVSALTRGALNAEFSCGTTNPVNPAIISITPQSGTSGTQVTVYGSGFNSNDQIALFQNGQQVGAPQAIQSATSNQIVFTLSGMLAGNLNPGVYGVSVFDPTAKGGAGSNLAYFTITSSGTIATTTTPVAQVQPIVITGVQYSPTDPYVNQMITTNVTVQNQSSEDFNSPFEVDVQGTTVTVPSLASGAQTIVTVPSAFSFSTPGTETLNTIIIYPSSGETGSGNTGNMFTNTLTFYPYAKNPYPASTTPVYPSGPTNRIDSQNPGEGLILAKDASLSVQYLSSVHADHSGSWGIFTADGVSDYANQANLTLTSTKTIKSVLFSTNIPGMAGFTSLQIVDGKQLYPAVVFYNGKQLNTAYDQTLGTYGPGNYTFTVYDQNGSNVMPYSTFGLTFYFTDGTYVTATTPVTATIQPVVPVTQGSTTPMITITSPVGATTWNQNTLGSWAWSSSSPVPSVDIYLENGSTYWPFATSYPNSGSFQWNVGAVLSGWKGVTSIPDGKYVIAVCPAGDYISLATCGEFSVDIIGTISNVSIVSPLSGQNFQAGGQFSLTFATPSQGDKYQINLLSAGIEGSPQYTLNNVVGVSGSQQTVPINIPASIPPGSYFVQVVQLTNQGSSCTNFACAQATSGAFTISSNTVASTAPVINYISPTSVRSLSSKINISGSGFDSNSYVVLSGQDSQTSSYSRNIKPISYTSTSIGFVLPSDVSAGSYSAYVAESSGISAATSNSVTFNVVTSTVDTSVPKVTITFPTNGTILSAGSSYTFTSVSQSPLYNVVLTIKNSAGNVIKSLNAAVIAAKSTFFWTIPSSWSSDTYTLSATTNEKPVFVDNGSFRVVKNQMPSIPNQTSSVLSAVAKMMQNIKASK